MDTSKKAESAHLLDDLESIRQLLGDEAAQPPLLTDTVHREGQIPLLFDVVGGKPGTDHDHEDHENHDDVDDVDEADIPTLVADTPDVLPPAITPVLPPPVQAQVPAKPNPDALLHLDSELRAAAQLIMQDVIDDFAPHIETEIKRRLEARLERLLAQQKK